MRIDFVELKTNTQQFTRKEAYALRKDRPHLWLQRLCCWTMRKLGAYDIGETLEYTRCAFDSRTFVEHLVKQQEHLIAFFHKNPTQLLIGAEDFAALMDNPEILNSVMSFDADLRKERTILGLKIKVIPWMRGILVMP